MRSTIFTSLALAGFLLSVPAVAQLPQDACFLFACDAACLAQAPDIGIAALSVRFNRLTAWEHENKVTSRHVEVAALMADQAQGARDGVAGKRLTQSAFCRSETMSCWTGGNAAHFSVVMPGAGGIEIETTRFPLADYGESELESDLTLRTGEPLRLALRLSQAPECPLE
ncbi:MAG: hypothetical protein ACXIVG_01170 [Pararhodobacter sp.]